MHPAGKRAALFDMDRTLVRKETASLYVRYQVDIGEASWADLLRTLSWVAQYTVGILDAEKVAEIVVAQIRGMHETVLAARCDEFDAAVSAGQTGQLAERKTELRQCFVQRRIVEGISGGPREAEYLQARGLLNAPRPIGPVAAQGVGYREVIDMLSGLASTAQTLSRIQARTRQFSKRQATWFRGLSEVRPCPLTGDEPPEETARRLAEEMGKMANGR